MDEHLRPVERIRSKKDFGEIYKKGRRLKGKYFLLVFQPNGLNYSRLGVVVSRKVGQATIRNRIKRRFRELFRRNKSLLPGHFDLVFIARPEIVQLDWEKMKAEYLTMVSQLNS
ncbi:MAG TPA: ribonuclease P protein component [Candidatus Saccharicenans sp.]|jgi:ribonuclease P protein component|nr:ribonuclease P protein component [Candidatus Saccharicenans sp.]HRD01449.1 ribonuclease P protein component [Candidatus Saccharicenans sp.]